MATEPRAMREIHEIRLKIYEETKHMTPKERTEYFNRQAEDVIREYGLKRYVPATTEPVPIA